MYRTMKKKNDRGKEIHAPLPIVTSGCSLIDGPYIIEHQLNKHWLKMATFKML